MEFDVLVCIPQLNYQKTLRLDHPLMSLNGLETRIRKNVTLPPVITFHQEKSENSPSLDASQTVKSYGYGAFTAEPKTLYIYFSPDQQEKSAGAQNTLETRNDKSRVSKTSNEQKKTQKILKEVPRDIMVTILNPYTATNHTFVAKEFLKLSELMEGYKDRIGWGKERGDLNFISLRAAEPHNLQAAISEIAISDEIILEVRKEFKIIQNGKREMDVIELNNEDDIEIIEKKVKLDDVKPASSSRKSKGIPRKANANKVETPPLPYIIEEVIIDEEDEIIRGENNEFFDGFVDNKIEPMEIQDEGLYLDQGPTESEQDTQILVDDFNEETEQRGQ